MSVGGNDAARKRIAMTRHAVGVVAMKTTRCLRRRTVAPVLNALLLSYHSPLHTNSAWAPLRRRLACHAPPSSSWHRTAAAAATAGWKAPGRGGEAWRRPRPKASRRRLRPRPSTEAGGVGRAPKASRRAQKCWFNGASGTCSCSDRRSLASLLVNDDDYQLAAAKMGSDRDQLDGINKTR